MSDDKKNYEIFKGKTLSNVFEDIYKNSDVTRSQITNLVTQLKPFVKSLDSAAVIVPLIKEYLEISVKNDEHLVKLADIVQRLLKQDSVGGGGAGQLTEREIEQLLSEVEGEQLKREEEEKRKQKVDEKLEQIKDELDNQPEEANDDGIQEG